MWMRSTRFRSTISKRGRNRRVVPAVVIVEPLEDRTLPAGALDAGFGANGLVLTDIGTAEETARRVMVQSDQKIVVVGASFGTDADFLVVRYNPDGSLDSTFGTGGKVVTSFGKPRDEAMSAVQQSDGKIVVAGWTGDWVGSPAKIDFGLARYNVDGSLDSTFGTNGRVTTAIGTSIDLVFSVMIQRDGKIVAAGATKSGEDNDFALVRYRPDGSLDSTFGSGGIVTATFGASTNDVGTQAILTSDDKIIVAGYSMTGLPPVAGNADMALARFNSDGSLDTSFGANGKVTASIGTGDDAASGVALQSDGKIVIAGYSYVSGEVGFALVRFNSNGSLDTTFSGDGKVYTYFGATGATADDIVAQADGKLVVIGRTKFGPTSGFELVQYDSNGNLDATFGAGGHVKTTFDTSSGTSGFSLALQGDGKFVAAGIAYVDSKSHIALARYEVGPDFSISAVSDSVPEGDSGSTAFQLTVTRSGIASGRGSVDYRVTGRSGSLADASDFGGQFPAGTVSFANGETRRTLTIPISGDTALESAEGFAVVLSNPSAGFSILTGTAIGTISNDDSVDAVYTAAGTARLKVAVVNGRWQVKVNEVIDTRYDAVAAEFIRSLRFTGGAGNDTISLIGLPREMYPLLTRIELNGGAGNDTLRGSDDFDETLTGGLGDDVLNGGVGGDDRLVESGGASPLTFVLTNSKLTGLGTDRLLNLEGAEFFGGLANETFNATAFTSPVTLLGGAGKDVLSGGAGDDSLSGGDGDDVLVGSGGDDLLLGGAGNDKLAGNSGNDELVGGEDSDTLVASGGTNYSLTNSSLIGEGTDTLRQIEAAAISTSNVAATIDASQFSGSGINTLVGGDGNDILVGGSGRDSIRAGSGDDIIRAGAGNDTVLAGAGHDKVDGDSGNDKLRGEDGHDSLFGQAGKDTLDGGTGNDALSGGDDNDSLLGLAGDDKLTGGLGDDVLSGGDGIDLLIEVEITNVRLGATMLTSSLGADGIETIEVASLTGTVSDDRMAVNGFSGAVNFDGQRGNDTLIGGSGRSTLVGGNGDDVILASPTSISPATLLGGNGNDTLLGGRGSDSLHGGSGDDTLIGGLGADTLDGGVGTDKAAGGMGGIARGGTGQSDPGDRITVELIDETFSTVFAVE